jgi:GT2 family glycosyltransferase
LPAPCFNQYNVAVLESAIHCVRSDFARVISRKFHGERFLLIGAAPKKLERQFGEMGRELVLAVSSADLKAKLRQDAATALFEIAIWFYPPEKTEDDRIGEDFSRCASGIVLIPGAGANVASRRPQLVECFRQFGFSPDYECDLGELDSGSLLLRHQSSATYELLISGVETAFARLNTQLTGVERMSRTRISELEAADRHIATLEEKLLKLKQCRSELKLLKEQRRALRRSPERRVGQVLPAPYRLPEKLMKAAWRKLHPPSARRRCAAPTEYQKWLQQHRVTASDLDRMRHEGRAFAVRPRISIITPVYDTSVEWLTEAVESVLTQAYETWEPFLIDDGSSAADLVDALPALAARDRRITLDRAGKSEGISAASNRALAHARGEWVTFLDHDDVLEPDALFQIVKLLQTHPDADLIYSDEDKLTDDGCEAPVFKPDWSPDLFRSHNYIGHLTAMRREIVQKVGGFRSEFDSAQDYDLFFRVIEQTDRIHHIPRVLYHWRRSTNSSAISVRQKPGQLEASRFAIDDHLKRRGKLAHVAVDWHTHAFCVRRELLEARKISIIIPARGRLEVLARRIESLTSKTSYPDYEIVVIQDDSQPAGADTNSSYVPHRLLHFSGAPNLSALRNFAIKQIEIPWLLFLDDDVEVIESDWLTIMAEHVQRPEVGAVGAQLLNPNGTIEHAGIVLGVNGIAEPIFRGLPAEQRGVSRQLQVTRNCSAVSGACMLARREVYQEVGGFDEGLPDSFADVDLCLKMRRAGYLIVYTPFAKLYKHAPQRDKIDTRSEAIMRERWSDVVERDPYYNPNLSRERADFSLGK